ncbi:MAG: YigZ family protein [Candidatus Latescibacterota bacterium]
MSSVLSVGKEEGGQFSRPDAVGSSHAHFMKYVVVEWHAEPMVVKRSVFIASCAPVHTKEEARLFLEAMRKKYPKASHYTYGFRIGPTAGLEGMSDDREPAGTAGQKIRFVLQRREFTDTIVVVTRFYGGTKLGRGGLARAYAHACGQVLDEVAWEEN